MDLRQQHNVRGSSSGQPQPQPQPQQYASPQQPAGGEGRKWWWPSLESKIVVTLVIIAALVVLVAFALATFGRNDDSASGFIDQDGWQAVFLSNGQVYFGKISSIDDKMLILEDIYYLQVDQQIQPEQGAEGAAQEPQVSLAKLGSELHGPQDQMFILMSEVVFWENLKGADESQVVNAIEDFKSNNGQLPTGQPEQSTESTEPAETNENAEDLPHESTETEPEEDEQTP